MASLPLHSADTRKLLLTEIRKSGNVRIKLFCWLQLLVHCLISGALGVMFEYGIGVRRNGEAAFKCLKEAAARGNVYAQGNLSVHYFRRKLLNKAADLAKR